MKISFLLIVFTWTYSGFCQKTIEGRIIDATSAEPLPYSNIWYKGTSVGTFSDAQGYFTLKAQDADTLTISTIGYNRLDIHKSETSKPILLTPQPIILDEVHIESTKSTKLRQIGYKKATLLKTNYLGVSFEKNQQQFWKVIIRNDFAVNGFIRNIHIGTWDSLPARGSLVISVFLRKGDEELPLLKRPKFFKVDLETLKNNISLSFEQKNIPIPEVLHAEITFIGVEHQEDLKGGLLDLKFAGKNHDQPVVFHRRSKDQPWKIDTLCSNKNTYSALNVWLDVAEF